MKRNIIFIHLLFLSMFCFSQQNMPRKIYGSIPDVNCTKLYEIQVGAFKDIKNGEKYISILQKNGFTPVYQQYLDYTRVKITGIPAGEIRSYLIKMKQMGFDEVIIREDTTEYILEEEPEEEIIIIEEYVEEAIIEEIIEAAVSETTPESRYVDRDIFCRTWKIVNSDKEAFIGYIMIFSNDGTYLITNINGDAAVAKWRWHAELDEFEYSHDNWKSYGRSTINQLDPNSLIFTDPGFNILGNGYSTIRKETRYELIPLHDFDTSE